MGKPCKYRLIKEYPGSPKKGSIHFWSVKEATDGWLGQIIYDNNPEFWEKVEEKNYEILDKEYVPGHRIAGSSDNPNMWRIESIKRLSDGEVL